MQLAALQRENILMEAISGSHAYGLAKPESDEDIRGVFYLTRTQFFSLDKAQQLEDEGKDVVYYELDRFFELLLKNNPNILELLAVPEDCIRMRHPIMDQLKPEFFLSKRCRDTFAGYALEQIKKARGLNKKVVNPVEPERKNILHFCYVAAGQGSLPLLDWLEKKGILQDQCGLVNIPHMKDVYALFIAPNGAPGFGIMRKEDSNDVSLSSIPAGWEPAAYMSFNRNGYSSYCKAYREYWDWVEKRNQARYQNTIRHGKGYDTKNMMHTFRLLDMAEEIARDGRIVVRRPNREFLLKIRDGAFGYEELVAMAEERIEMLNALYEMSGLPERPDEKAASALLVEIREMLYQYRSI